MALTLLLRARDMTDEAAALQTGVYPRHPLHTSVDDAIRAAMCAGEGDSVQVGEILDVLATRPIGPLLFVPALIAILPGIGALPGVTWGTAALILLISAQMVFTRNSHWAPEPLRRLRLKRSILEKSLSWARPMARWIDKATKPRLVFLVRGPLRRLVGLTVLLMSVVMFAASIIPGLVIAPGLAVLILSIALTTQDGVVAVIGHTLAFGAIGLAVWLL
jgi:hypothetical protein